LNLRFTLRDQSSREERERVVEPLQSDRVRLDLLLQFLTIVGEAVNVRGCELAINIGSLEWIDLRDLEKSLRRLVPGIDIGRLRLALTRLSHAIVLELRQLVENFRRNGSAVAAMLTCRHGPLCRDEASIKGQQSGLGALEVAPDP
jgi:hypothetical protein